MVEYNKYILRILFLLTLHKNVEASCYYYYNGYRDIQYCYYSPYLIILGASYGSLIGLGILVSLIVCCCCIHKKNREWNDGTFIVQAVPGTNNPGAFPSGNYPIQQPLMASAQGIQNPYIMMGQTHYGSSQRQETVPVNFQTTSLGAGANPAGTVQPESK
ncbi:uncharacterized protein LOC133194418 [Saccostrea echinata]|uniref:uncharacterized protein LOC133194418 n=1 Tax=Saccostrea echinata TaxID=191078 RepID=UPI002A7FFBAE|nr:uncharacterized protein LOC133194418 [Saccostrea echinata]